MLSKFVGCLVVVELESGFLHGQTHFNTNRTILMTSKVYQPSVSRSRIAQLSFFHEHPVVVHNLQSTREKLMYITCKRPPLVHVDIYVPPTATYLQYRVIGLTPMAVGLSQSLAQQSGIVSQISSGTRQSALTLSDVY